jgi:hypothetical protein
MNGFNGSGLGSKGVRMSTMHAPSRIGSVADVSRLLAPVRREQAPAPRRPAAPSDMMYAWSMGAAANRTATFANARGREDRCPPEVYLG